MAFINLGQITYPIGTVYMSKTSTSPSTLFGGTWAEITGAVLRANKQAGVYSDSDTHTLTIDEMPKHQHSLVPPDNPKHWMYGHDWGNNASAWSAFSSAVFNTTPRNTGYMGGGQAHTTKQRAYNVYAWVRTA